MSEASVHSLNFDAPTGDVTSTGFADAMQQLANEAEVGRPTPGASVSKAARGEFLLAIGQMIRPLAISVEGLGERLSKLAAAQEASSAPDLAPVHATLEAVRVQLGRMGNVESANQKLFDALHNELKGYKDGFLFDALQKPFVRDLLALNDDLSALFAQVEARRASLPTGSEEAAFFTTLSQNFDNARHGLLETLERLDVEQQDTAPGDPVDKRQHRIINFEPSVDALHGGQVARSLRPGFSWRGRPLRPEEIVATRWTEPTPAEPASPPPSPGTPEAATE